MSKIDKEGMLIDAKVIIKRFARLEHGNVDAMRAIVLHQTDSPTAAAAFNSYGSSNKGTHFLIDKNGSIYQTASLHKRCYHVGQLIKSRCLEIKKSRCHDKQIAKVLTRNWVAKLNSIDKIERGKKYPSRFPVNSDSIGIELVGMHLSETRYEVVTLFQSLSLQWLIDQLYLHFSLSKDDVFRHPEVSYKNPGEAASAAWK